ncbi:MAG TPA: TonB-dependent receptor, partial [Candidatus Angelobacter sp.]|nr:TonB-dependent receptor [Candidatus Angelobacter sp.]
NANTQNFFTALGARRSNLTSLGVITQAQVVNAIDPTHVATGAFFSLPGTTPVFDKVSYAVPSDAGAGIPQNTYSMVNRFDYNFTTNTNMYARYAYSSENDMVGSNNNSPYAGYDTGASQQNHNALVSVTHVFSPSIVSTSKVTYNRFFNFQPLGTAPVGPTMYFTGTTPLKVLGTTVDLPGYSAESPGNAIPFGGPQNLYQLSQDLSWTRGKHQFRFGGAYVHMRDNRVFGAFEEAVEDLSGGNKVTGFNNFVTGTLNDFQAAVNPQGKYPCVRDLTTGAITTDPALLAACTVNLPVGAPAFNRNNRYNDASLYAQDSWKLIPRLTINAGLRWEYFGTQHNANPMLDSNFYFGSGATFFDRIRNGSMQLAPNSPIGELWKPSSKFAPRVGFAWDPFGDHKTSVRGGYGISYERNFGNVTFNVIQNPPNYFVLLLTPADLGSPIPISPNNAGPLAGAGSKQLPRSTGRIVDPNIPTAYAEFWSLTVEHEVAKNTLVGVDYTGSNGIHLYDIANINQNGSGTVYKGDLVTNRLDPQYGNLNYRGANGFSRYNAMNARLQSRNLFNTGLQFNMNYTWSHAIDNLSSTFSESTNNSNLGYLDPFNPGLDKGNADFDVRHRLTTSAIWDVPWLKSAQNTWIRQVFGGWSVAPIFTARTGTPYTIFDCANEKFVRCPRMFANSITSVDGSAGASTKVAGASNLYNWYTIPASAFFGLNPNSNCPTKSGSYFDPVTCSGEFPTCPVNMVGTTAISTGTNCAWPANMTGRNMFRGPGWWNADLGIYKQVKLTERFGLQLRGEMYNLFNHHNFVLNASNNDVSGTTMQVKKYGTRNVQLGAKVTF